MAAEDEALKRRYREFLDLMPLTLAIAGLSISEGHRSFSTDQMEARAQALVSAFKFARLAARDAIGAGRESS